MKKYIGGIIGGVALAGIVIWIIFYTVNNRDNSRVFDDKKSENIEAQAIISKNLDRFYPSTVREVVRLFQRINVCLKSNTYTEDEYYKLVDKLMMLYDDELVEKNPRDKYATSLYDDISAFKQAGKAISVTNIQLDSQADRYEIDGRKMASIVGLYVVKTKSGLAKTYEKYILREDEDGNWKILGWELTDPVEFPD